MFNWYNLSVRLTIPFPNEQQYPNLSRHEIEIKFRRHEIEIKFRLNDGTTKVSSKSKVHPESNYNLKRPIAFTAALFLFPT